MNPRLTRHDWLYLIALLVGLLPLAALPLFGLRWLWQSDGLFWWLGALFLCATLGLGLLGWLQYRGRRLLAEHETGPDPDWTSRDRAAWASVKALAGGLKPQDWPLDEHLWRLGRETLEMVAKTYQPRRDRPLLELTLPHGLLIIERVCHDLRRDIADTIPLSHRLTLGDLVRLDRWRRIAGTLYPAFRAGRLVLNPASALLSEVKAALGNRAFETAWTDLRRWLLQEYVRKLGHYAIELYSGRLVLDGQAADDITAPSRPEWDRAAMASAQRLDEPLRILVIGRASSGKSSLINALFGEVLAATDCLPDLVSPITPYRLTRDGLTPALVFDTPGIDTPALAPEALDELVEGADLILWVTAAQRPDREWEGGTLERLRRRWEEHPERHPPTLLVAVSHIDLLRPRQEWRPPYDLNDPSNAKAGSIRAAVEAVATDLVVPIERVIPVCLAEGRVYNLSDSLWSAILVHQPAANRVRLQRLRGAQQRDEDWALLRRQLASTGRFLLKLPGRLLG